MSGAHVAPAKPPAKKPPAKPPAAAAPAAPTAPARVDPFLTGDDLQTISAFYTDLNTKLASITAEDGTYDAATGKWSGGSLEADTTYQKTQTDTGAKQQTSSAQDDAIARGIFSSSVKDATLYDIEAQRSLSNKFLDDKLTSARLTAGTNQQILGTAKSEFDKRYGSTDASGNPIWGTKAFENAQGVNDSNDAAFAAAMAAFNAANPAAPAAGAPAAGAPKPPAAKPPAGPHPGGGAPAAKPPAQRPANQSGTHTGSTKPRARTTVTYGNGHRP